MDNAKKFFDIYTKLRLQEKFNELEFFKISQDGTFSFTYIYFEDLDFAFETEKPTKLNRGRTTTLIKFVDVDFRNFLLNHPKIETKRITDRAHLDNCYSFIMAKLNEELLKNTRSNLNILF